MVDLARNLLRLLAVLALVVPGAARAEELPRPAHPLMSLPAEYSGAAAVSAIGTNLKALAASYGLTAEQLSRRLLQDPGLRVDRRGHLYVSTPAPPRPKRVQGFSAKAARPLAAVPAEPVDVFKLHSRPGSQRTIYLNFVGRSITGTRWNETPGAGSAWHGPGGPITVQPFSTSTASQMTATRRAEIIANVWKRVAEDFAPLDVDVTTEAPPSDRLIRESLTDDVFGMEVVYAFNKDVAQRGAGDFYCNCAASALPGSFSSPPNGTDPRKLAFVWYASEDIAGDVAGNYDLDQFLADYASHAVGVTLGLQPDYIDPRAGTYHPGFEYPSSWAPIMGAPGYGEHVSQFSQGDYANDLKVPPDFNAMDGGGLELLPDDAGNDMSSARPLEVARNAATGQSTGSFAGLIRSNIDVDMFRIWAAPGPLIVSVNGAEVGANANLKLTLLDSSGVQLAVSDPQVTPQSLMLSADLSYQVTSQQIYFLKVQGVGEGDPKDGGYSDYGSVGAYTLDAKFNSPPATAPTASFTMSPQNGGPAPLRVTFDPTGSTDPAGGFTAFHWLIREGSAEPRTEIRLDTIAKTSVSHEFKTPGRKEVTLTVASQSGLTATSATRSFDVLGSVNAKPEAKFTGLPLVVSAGLTVRLDPKESADSDGSITTYRWSFSDDNSVVERSSTEPIEHTFTRAGTFRVTLTVTDNGTPTPETGVTFQEVQVTSGNVAPVARITATPDGGGIVARDTDTLQVTLDASGSSDVDGAGYLKAFVWTVNGVTVPGQSATRLTRALPVGTHSVTLVVRDGVGLASTAATTTITVRRNTPPTARFTASPLSGKSTLNVFLDGSASTSGDSDLGDLIKQYIWTVSRVNGDGTRTPVLTETFGSPFYTASLSVAGTYEISLTVTDSGNLTDSANGYDPGNPLDTANVRRASVSASERPLAVIGASKVTGSGLAGAAPLTINFDAIGSSDSDGNIQSYVWNFGDGSGDVARTSGVQFPYVFQAPGIYAVTLRAIDDTGTESIATDKSRVTITVYGTPRPHFTATPVAGKERTILFDPRQSSDVDGITDYSWDFGDGTRAVSKGGNSAPFEYTFATAKSYTVTLTVKNAGQITARLSLGVTVGASGVAPLAGFDMSAASGPSPLRSSFSALFALENGPASYSWDFGDGTPKATGVTVTHDFLKSRTQPYNVTLTVTNAAGISSSITRQVTVNKVAPVARMRFLPDPLDGRRIMFDASDSYDVDGTIVSYNWAFQYAGTDGAVSKSLVRDVRTSPAPFLKVFDQSGPHLIILTVTDDQGAYTAISNTFDVNQSPVANFDVVPAKGSARLPVTLDASKSSDDRKVELYQWSYDYEGPAVPPPQWQSQPTNTPFVTGLVLEQPGVYTFKLKVSDVYGKSSEAVRKVIVGAAPDPSFTYGVATGPAPSAVTFDASAAAAGAGGAIVNYRWIFEGDGAPPGENRTTGNAFTRMFPSGSYKVALEVTDSFGSTKVSDKKAFRINRPPQPVFDISTLTGGPGAPLTVQLVTTGSSDDVTNPAPVVTWSVPGDGVSLAGTLRYSFSRSGVFPVTMTMRDSDGATSSLTKYVTVTDALPTAVVANLPVDGAAPLDISLNATGSSDAGGSIVRYRWRFTGPGSLPDEVRSAAAAFTKRLTEPGTYTVALEVTDNSGNTVTSRSQTIQLRAQQASVTDFTMSRAVGPPGMTVEFDPSPTRIATGAISAYRFEFPELASPGNIVNLSTPTKIQRTFPREGIYTVRLTAFDSVRKLPITPTMVKYVQVTAAAPDNRPPTASFTVSRDIGRAPYTVELNAAGSSDPDGQPLSSYSWSFEGPAPDGTGSAGKSGQQTSKTFGTAGSYTVKLQVKDAAELVNTVETARTINVIDTLPVAEFSAVPVAGTSLLRMQFDGRLSKDPIGITRYDWDFGDGASASNDPAPQHDFTRPGNFTVTLTITTADNLTRTANREVKVNEAPVPRVSWASGPVPGSIRFDATASSDDKAVTKYEWDFGDGTADVTSNNSQPLHVYSSARTFNVVLTVRDAEGRSASSRPVPVVVTETPNQVPTAVLVAPVTDGEAPLDVALDAWSSSDPDGTISKYLWTIGTTALETDGPFLRQTFDTAGSVPVTLRVRDDRGAVSAAVTTTITVRVPDKPPVPRIYAWVDQPNGSGPVTRVPFISGLAPFTVAFQGDLSDDDGKTATDNGIRSYLWDFGDGTNTSSAPNPSHQFSAPGNYTVRLTVTDSAGAKASITRLIRVNRAPEARFTWAAAPAAQPRTILFNGTASTDDSGFLRYEWDFGDGSNPPGSSDATPAHEYRKAGTYDVVLTVRDAEGVANSTQRIPVTVAPGPNLPPVPAFSTGTARGSLPLVVTLDAEAADDPDGAIRQYDWSFKVPPGAPPIASILRTSAAPFPVTFGAVGTYTVTLQVTDDLGATASTQRSVTVDALPVPRITANRLSGPSPLVVSLDGLASTSPAEGLQAFDWIFSGPSGAAGPGTVKRPTGAAITRVFSAPGTYEVRLRVTDSQGAVATSEPTTITVGPAAAAAAGFSFSPARPVKAPATLSFTATPPAAPSGAVSYAWEFADGSADAIATGASPTHRFTRSGIFPVRLTITDGTGARVAYQEVEVLSTDPRAEFSLSPDRGLESLTANFDASASTDADGAIVKYRWTFTGPVYVDPVVRTSGAPFAKTFTAPGAYTATLQVTDNMGNTNTSAPSRFSINTPPVVQFITEPGQQPLSLSFDAGKTVDDGSVVSDNFAWDFGDGSPSKVGERVTHVFPAPGNYRVTLSARDNNNSVGTLTRSVTVKPAPANEAPVADFAMAGAVGPAPLSVAFDAATSSDDVGIASYAWDFGDGSTGAERSGRSTTHVFRRSGTFLVRLTVRDDSGASSTTERAVTVSNAPPVAQFKASPQAIQASQSVSLDASASADRDGTIATYRWTVTPPAGVPAVIIPEQASGAAFPVTFRKAGTYMVGLQVTDNRNATTTAPPTLITVSDPPEGSPTAVFTMSPATGVAPLAVRFDGSASTPGGSAIETYAWSIGSPVLATRAGPVPEPYVFTRSGTFPVTLTVTDLAGRSNSFKENVVVINAAPRAVFTAAPSQAAAPLDVTLDAGQSRDDDGDISTFRWSVTVPPGVAPITIPDKPGPVGTAFSVRLPKHGSYVFSLKAIDNFGRESTVATREVIAQDAPPTASFTASASQLRARAPLQLDAQGSTDAGGAIAEYIWSVNGVEQQRTQGPRHTMTFDAPGDYTIGLVVKDDGGLLSQPSVTRTVRVIPENVAPSAVIGTSRRTGNAPLTVTFTGSGSTDTDSGIASYAWDFGDTTGSSLADPPAHTFTQAGTYTVRLTVTDRDGASHTDRVDIAVNGIPQARFIWSRGSDQLSVSLSAGGSTDDKGITAYEWAFGDGTTDTGMQVNHVFDKAGTYRVTLTVRDAEGASHSSWQDVTVTSGPPPNQPPEARIGVSVSSGVAPLSVAFNGSGSSDDKGIVSYAWDFGDGSADALSNQANPPHVFRTAGQFRVTLTVTDAEGETSQAKVYVTVSPAVPPVALFTADRVTGVAPLTVTFDPSPSHDDGKIETYLWRFDDGTTRTETSNVKVPKTFTTAGSHRVTLQVTDNASLSSEYSLDVTVTEAPVVPGPKVAGITLRFAKASRQRVSARGEVMVVDAAGRPLRRAVVTAMWSGPFTLTKWGTTRSNGRAAFTTSPTTGGGCYRLTVTEIRVGASRFTPAPSAYAELCR